MRRSDWYTQSVKMANIEEVRLVFTPVVMANIEEVMLVYTAVVMENIEEVRLVYTISDDGKY